MIDKNGSKIEKRDETLSGNPAEPSLYQNIKVEIPQTSNFRYEQPQQLPVQQNNANVNLENRQQQEYPQLNEIMNQQNKNTINEPGLPVNTYNSHNLVSNNPNFNQHHYYAPPRQPDVIIVERPIIPEPEVVVVEQPIFYGYEDYTFPKLSLTVAWLLLVVNIILPGIGTMIVGCLDVPNPSYFILSGFFQLLTAYFIIGWILAIWTSISLIIYAT